MLHQKIIILDLGSKFTQLIARKVRQAGVFCEVYPYDVNEGFLRLQMTQGLKGIILSGSLDADSEASFDSAVYQLDLPVLAIGRAMEVLCKQLGGSIGKTQEHSALNPIVPSEFSALFNTLEVYQNKKKQPILDVWSEYLIENLEIPAGFKTIAKNGNYVMGASDEDRQLYAVLFHPEVSQTKQGEALISRFILDICQCDSDWNMSDYVDEAIEKIQEQVGQERVILALSGGVDSSVAAALIHKAIGDQLICVFVDHGLLRLNEAKQVMQILNEHLGVNIIHVNAIDQFMVHLEDEVDPEIKRRIIGREFIEVFQEQAESIENARWLAQGTIYPDVIESAKSKSGQASVKSHHNVGGLPDTLDLKLLEPLRDLFKDEVRELGVVLGLPDHMVYRHPFPGPGLGVRILGAVNQNYADILRLADDIFIQELRKTIEPDSGRSWYDLTSQAFAVFLPVKSVGVSAQGRKYEYVIALRAVVTSDFMTAAWAELPYDLLNTVSTRIINEVEGVSRVVYDVSGKPPATIEWE